MRSGHTSGVNVLMVDGSVRSEGHRDETSSCWIRVSQVHAGDDDAHLHFGQSGRQPTQDGRSDDTQFFVFWPGAADDGGDGLFAGSGGDRDETRNVYDFPGAYAQRFDGVDPVGADAVFQDYMWFW